MTSKQRVRRIGRITAAAVLALCAVWTAATKLNADSTDEPAIVPVVMAGPSASDVDAPAANAPRARDFHDVLTLAFDGDAPSIPPRLAQLLEELDVEGLPIRVALGDMPSDAASIAGATAASDGARFAPPPQASAPGSLAGVGPGRSSPDDASDPGSTPDSSNPADPGQTPNDPEARPGDPGPGLTPAPQPEGSPLPDVYPEPPTTPLPAAPPVQVPEPGSLVLLAAGLFGIFWLRRRSIRRDP